MRACFNVVSNVFLSQCMICWGVVAYTRLCHRNYKWQGMGDEYKTVSEYLKYVKGDAVRHNPFMLRRKNWIKDCL